MMGGGGGGGMRSAPASNSTSGVDNTNLYLNHFIERFHGPGIGRIGWVGWGGCRVCPYVHVYPHLDRYYNVVTGVKYGQGRGEGRKEWGRGGSNGEERNREEFVRGHTHHYIPTDEGTSLHQC